MAYTFADIVTSGGVSFKTDLDRAQTNFTAIETELNNCMGSLSSVAARLDIALQSSGELRDTQAAASDWKDPGWDVEWVSNTSFKVTDPATTVAAILEPGRMVMFNSTTTPVYAVIRSVSFAAAATTCVVYGNTNVPTIATLTGKDDFQYGIVRQSITGSFRPTMFAATKPTYTADYAGTHVLAVDTGMLWFGNPVIAAFQALGGTMYYKDWTNSAKGGTAVSVADDAAIAARRFQLDFDTPTDLVGILRSLVVCGTTRAAITSTDFDVKVYTELPTGTWATDAEFCVFEAYGLNGAVKPYGLVNHQLAIMVESEDASALDSLWVEIVNNVDSSSPSTFDVEAAVELMMEG